MVVPRYADGAAIPTGGAAPVPGTPPTPQTTNVFRNPLGTGLEGGPTAPAGVPAPSLSTNFLTGLVAQRRQESAARLQAGQAGLAWVYLGKQTHATRFSGHPGSGQTRQEQIRPELHTVQSLLAEFDRMTMAQRTVLARKLFMAGFLSSPDANLMDLQEAYGNMLATAAARYAQGQNVTPDRLLENNIRYNLAASGIEVKGKFSDKTTNQWFAQLQAHGADSALGRAAGAKKGKAPEPDLSGKFSTTSRQVDIYSPSDARGLIRATLHKELGRDPSEQEFEEFVSTLQAAQREHPIVTKTTETRDKTGFVTNTNSVSRGGINPQEFATEQAQANPHWAEWQAVGTYFPALIDALSTAVPGT